jgi:hypothetical protein
VTTIKTRDWHRGKIDAIFSFTVSLPRVMTMTPDTTPTAVRTTLWSVRFRMMLQMIKVLIQ